MNITIDEKGMMLIDAENSLEAYALTKWCDENFDTEEPSFRTGNILVNMNFKMIAKDTIETINNN